MKPVSLWMGSVFGLYGVWIRRLPGLFCLALFGVFWLYRSYIYSGDGDQITRMVEAGYWMVHSELLSQAVFQGVYRMLKPWGWDGLSVIQWVSCAAGALSVWVLLRFNTRVIRLNPLWALGLFFSSGLALYCNGHTEYYTQFLVFLLLYGYMGVLYLRDESSALWTSLVFSLGAWMHLGILFALPSLLVLPLLRRYRWRDYRGIALGLIPFAAIYLLKMSSSLTGFYIHGLSPDTNFVPLYPDPSRPEFYTFLSVWHLLDWVYGWAMRSWLFWFLVWLGGWIEGWRALVKPERLFLLIYTLCYSGFTVVWHPNLGMQQDWDLFAFEAAPCLLLVLTFMPGIVRHSYWRVAVAVPLAASVTLMVHQIDREAQFDRRGYGTASLRMETFPKNLTYNGHNKYELKTVLRQGHYSVKIIEPGGKKDFFAHIAPRVELVIPGEEVPYTPVEMIQPPF